MYIQVNLIIIVGIVVIPLSEPKTEQEIKRATYFDYKITGLLVETPHTHEACLHFSTSSSGFYLE